MSTAPHISVVLPAFNEEENLGATLSQLHDYLQHAFPSFEVIVVDDGSTDGTARVAEGWSQRDARYRLIRHETNRGYGAALRSDFAAARGELVFFMDSDGQFDIRDLDRFLPHIAEYDGVIGYRVRRRDHLVRRINAFGWNLISRTLLGLPFRDVDCAFKLYHRRVLDAVRIESSGAMINAEMLAKIRNRGFRLKEVGVNHYPRRAGVPTGGNLRVIVRAFLELVALYGRLRAEADAPTAVRR